LKYIYKYIYKGYDACTVNKSLFTSLTVVIAVAEEGGTMQYNEIVSFLNARYVESTEEDDWRIF